ncbi:hypothetical protein EV138_1085 [Kribbella voronezhensis]|uniref:HNH endonuclease n=1 Tax=Kribbella voronezhensis TaxID=2512212 RepID=A0A4R7T6V7_9ACTN|nr:HNH endonuclease [Kribbella voronezhensis]TDU87561.1 hypothetical protein EV138_1085 [Kribbella voronezhensis]
MSRDYTKPTLKLLFGRATHCAYPNCTSPLIFEDRGRLTVSVDIAHIRSESPDGPRYDSTYPEPLIDSEENLLLLCGIHHRPVDQHEVDYPVSELLEWKRRQVTASSGRQLSEQQLEQIVQQVQQSLATLTEVKLAVQPVGLVLVNHGWLSVPLEGLGATTLSKPDQGQYLGVEVTNEGLVPVTVNAVGIDVDIDASPFYASYQFLLDDSSFLPSRRLEGKSSASWPAHIPTVQASILEIAKTYRRVPRRFRCFVKPGAGDRAEGTWMSILHLPIWKSDITEERLLDVNTSAAESQQWESGQGTS